jgi:hypothetical protein
MSRNETNRRGFPKTAAATADTVALGEYGSDFARATEMLGPIPMRRLGRRGQKVTIYLDLVACLLILLSFSLPATAQQASSQMGVKVVSRPEPLTPPSPLYSFNREPLAPNSMAKLPLGSVHARGWLGHQLELMTTGMTGRLPEVSSYLKPENGWFGSDKEGWT